MEQKDWIKNYVYDFSVAYNAISVADILDIRKYLMRNSGIVWKYSDFWSKFLFQQWCFFGCNMSGGNSLNVVPKCIWMNNQKCKIRPESTVINIYL